MAEMAEMAEDEDEGFEGDGGVLKDHCWREARDWSWPSWEVERRVEEGEERLVLWLCW